MQATQLSMIATLVARDSGKGNFAEGGEPAVLDFAQFLTGWKNDQTDPLGGFSNMLVDASAKTDVSNTVGTAGTLSTPFPQVRALGLIADIVPQTTLGPSGNPQSHVDIPDQGLTNALTPPNAPKNKKTENPDPVVSAESKQGALAATKGDPQKPNLITETTQLTEARTVAVGPLLPADQHTQSTHAMPDTQKAHAIQSEQGGFSMPTGPDAASKMHMPLFVPTQSTGIALPAPLPDQATEKMQRPAHRLHAGGALVPPTESHVAKVGAVLTEPTGVTRPDLSPKRHDMSAVRPDLMQGPKHPAPPATTGVRPAPQSAAPIPGLPHDFAVRPVSVSDNPKRADFQAIEPITIGLPAPLPKATSATTAQSAILAQPEFGPAQRSGDPAIGNVAQLVQATVRAIAPKTPGPEILQNVAISAPPKPSPGPNRPDAAPGVGNIVTQTPRTVVPGASKSAEITVAPTAERPVAATLTPMIPPDRGALIRDASNASTGLIPIPTSHTALQSSWFAQHTLPIKAAAKLDQPTVGPDRPIPDTIQTAPAATGVKRPMDAHQSWQPMASKGAPVETPPTQIKPGAEPAPAVPANQPPITPPTAASTDANPTMILQAFPAPDAPLSDSIQTDGAEAIIELTSESGKTEIAREVPRVVADPKIPRQIAEQLASVVKQMPNGPVEVTLNPEELGRVRMTLSGSDGTMAVSLTIERPETADLMRRNLTALGAEFRQLGYSDVTFSFTGNGAEQRSFQDDQPTEAKTSTPSGAQDDPDATPPQTTKIATTTALDLRM